jgi:hypothetical protein
MFTLTVVSNMTMAALICCRFRVGLSEPLFKSKDAHERGRLSRVREQGTSRLLDTAC